MTERLARLQGSLLDVAQHRIGLGPSAPGHDEGHSAVMQGFNHDASLRRLPRAAGQGQRGEQRAMMLLELLGKPVRVPVDVSGVVAG